MSLEADINHNHINIDGKIGDNINFNYHHYTEIMGSNYNQLNLLKLEKLQIEHKLAEQNQFVNEFQPLIGQLNCSKLRALKEEQGEFKQDGLIKMKINEFISQSYEMVMLADMATFNINGSALVRILQKNAIAARASVFKRCIKAIQQSIIDTLKPYQALPIVMQNKRLKADISHTQNELLNDFRNKHELESQLDVIVKTGQKTQLDLEKTDLEFHGLTAEEQTLGEQINTGKLAESTLNTVLAESQAEYVQCQLQLSQFQSDDNQLSPLLNHLVSSASQNDAVSAAEDFTIATMVETHTDIVDNTDHSDDNPDIATNANFIDGSAPVWNQVTPWEESNAGMSGLASITSKDVNLSKQLSDKSQNVDDANIQLPFPPAGPRLGFFQDDNLKETHDDMADNSFSFLSQHANHSGNIESFVGLSGSFQSPEESSRGSIFKSQNDDSFVSIDNDGVEKENNELGTLNFFEAAGNPLETGGTKSTGDFFF